MLVAYRKLDMWKGDSCNAINGTDGTIWPAGVKSNDRLYFFIPDVCRYVYSLCALVASYAPDDDALLIESQIDSLIV